MPDASRSEAPGSRAAGEQQLSLAGTWRRLNFEQCIAAVAALLLIVSTLGPFSFVEAAIVLIGAGVLLLLRKRAEGKVFHIPFGDGAVIAVAGAWAGFLIFVRIVDRPLGQTILAMVCASTLLLAGLRERAKRPPDDLPPGVAEPGPPAAPPPDADERVAPPVRGAALPPPAGAAARGEPASPPAGQETAETQALPAKVLPPATPHGARRRPAAPADQPPLWDEPTD